MPMLIQELAQGTMGMYRRSFLREVVSKLRSKMRTEVNMAKRGIKGGLGKRIQLHIQKPENKRVYHVHIITGILFCMLHRILRDREGNNGMR